MTENISTAIRPHRTIDLGYTQMDGTLCWDPTEGVLTVLGGSGYADTLATAQMYCSDQMYRADGSEDLYVAPRGHVLIEYWGASKHLADALMDQEILVFDQWIDGPEAGSPKWLQARVLTTDPSIDQIEPAAAPAPEQMPLFLAPDLG